MAPQNSTTNTASKKTHTKISTNYSSRGLALAMLPRELFESTVLTEFCDGYTLYQFWLATVGARNQPSLWSNKETEQESYTLIEEVQAMLKRVLMRRRKQQLQTRTKRKLFPEMQLGIAGFLDPQYSYPQHPLQAFYTLDYTEQVPLNLVWSGRLQFRDPRALRAFDATSALIEEVVHVMVFTSRNNNVPSSMRQWDLGLQGSGNNSLQAEGDDTNESDVNATTRIVLQTYNFSPVGSGARIVGVTVADRKKLRRISQRMAQDDLVGTLETSHRRRGTNAINFAPRFISFTQARQRLERLPSSLLKFEKNVQTLKAYPTFEAVTNDWNVIGENQDLGMNSDECSLHCTWVIEEDFAISRQILQPQEEAALFKNYWRYRKLFRLLSSADGAIGW